MLANKSGYDTLGLVREEGQIVDIENMKGTEQRFMTKRENLKYSRNAPNNHILRPFSSYKLCFKPVDCCKSLIFDNSALYLMFLCYCVQITKDLVGDSYNPVYQWNTVCS